MREKVGPANPVPMSEVTTYKAPEDLKKHEVKKKWKRARPTRSRKRTRRKKKEEKTADEVIKGIFNELTKGSKPSDRRFIPIRTLCNAIGISKKIMEDYLFIIELIQSQPRINSGYVSLGGKNWYVYSINEIPVLR